MDEALHDKGFAMAQLTALYLPRGQVGANIAKVGLSACSPTGVRPCSRRLLYFPSR